MMNFAATFALDSPTSFGLPLHWHHARGRDIFNVPEQELTVKVTDVDRVHVYYMNVLESGQGEVGQDLAPQPTRTNDKDLAFVA